MTISGLTISLDSGGGRVSPRLDLVPGPGAARLLVGRDPAAAAALVPLVFNLCAVAQGRAARAALALPETGDEAVLRFEHMRDHVLCLGIAVPSMLGRAPDREMLTRFAQCSAGDDPPASAARLRDHLLGPSADDPAGLTPAAYDRLLAAGETPLLRLLSHLRSRLRPDWGRADLPRPSADEVAIRLEGGEVAPRETTALDAVADQPLVQALEAIEGRSLFVRLTARLLDLLRKLDPATSVPAAQSPRPGVGVAGAVRGVLGHRAEVVDGRVASYGMLSPTDWNLAPDGLLTRVLAALPVGEDLPLLACLSVACVNPCVATTIMVDGRKVAAHA